MNESTQIKDKVVELENSLSSMNDYIADRILAHGPLCICGHQKEYHWPHPIFIWQTYRKCCASFCQCKKFVFLKDVDVEVFRCSKPSSVKYGSES